MIKSIYFHLLVCCVALVLTSCDTTTSERDASLLTVQQLKFTPGYEWYDIEFQAYSPDAAVISQIKTIVQSKDLKYFIYVNPSCACTGTQKRFPSIMKVLIESGVPESKFEIYSMLKTSNNHPYKNKLKVNDLPAFFAVKDDIQISSVLDTLAIRNANNPNYDPTIEELLLEVIANL